MKHKLELLAISVILLSGVFAIAAFKGLDNKISSVNKLDSKAINNLQVHTNATHTTTISTSEEITTTVEETTIATTTVKTTRNNVTKETTTKAPTTTTVKTTKPKVVSSENLQETLSEEVKYGTKISKYKSYVLNTYSDGTTKITNERTYQTLDNSGYSSTTMEMFPEASNLASSEIGKLNEMTGYVNEYRAEVGAAPVVLDMDLSKAAMVRALELAYSEQFSHTRPNGQQCWSVFTDLNLPQGYHGENIAAGHNDVKATAVQWRESQGHYENMINTNYNKIGVGYVYLKGTKYGAYWVQLFSS